MITNIIKKYVVAACCVGCCCVATLTSCSDMLETDSSHQNIDPEITSKTDSLFYTFGIMQAMQQLADQYVFQGEMRGDLVQPTAYADSMLTQLYDFSAKTNNRYDSAYVYYRVINNCNYYIANRDTALYKGSTNVVINEYAAVKAIRAWAYLQLARNYGRVPFFTEPLTQISKIDNNTFPELDIYGLAGELAADLEPYSGFPLPDAGNINVGSPNWSTNTKMLATRFCYIPVDVILGELYLETEQYDAAATHFINYLTQNAHSTSTNFLAPMASKGTSTGYGRNEDSELPDRSSISASVTTSPSWAANFANNPLTTGATVYDVITYIPMAVTKENGCTTNLPMTFGFNYYGTTEETGGDPYIDEIQLKASSVLNTLSDSTEYYYYYEHQSSDNYDSVRIAKAGDMRLRSIMTQRVDGDSVIQYMDKYKYANIVLYRTTTIWLYLAECFNRLGMPDAAFAILKDGISEELLLKHPVKIDTVTTVEKYYAEYVTESSRQALQTQYPLLSDANLQYFPVNRACGIHCHGAGRAASDFATATNGYKTGVSPYSYDRMTGIKLNEIAEQFGVAVGTTAADTINAVEDMLCDEYALEFAFEGRRWYDLMRLARHKNTAATYGGNFGSLWLARKLAFKNPKVNLEDKNNWYLPFK